MNYQLVNNFSTLINYQSETSSLISLILKTQSLIISTKQAISTADIIKEKMNKKHKIIKKIQDSHSQVMKN